MTKEIVQPFKTLTLCSRCPCYDDSIEACNLGYPTKYGEVAYDDGSSKWLHYSENCELMQIKTQGRTYLPEIIEVLNL